MVVSNYTFEQMLDMIEVNKLLGYKVFKEKSYSYLEELNNRLRKKEKLYCTKIFSYSGVVAFGLENAFINGNKKDSSLPIILNVFGGAKGLVTRIEDVGNGFDFKKTQKKYENNEKYFNYAGCGFNAYNRNDVLVSFENKGATLNILYFFNHEDLKQRKVVR